VAKITVLPSGIEYEAKAGDTLMGAALAHGLYWPTTCGGQAICTTCLTEIVEGAEGLVEMSRNERKTLVAERGESILQRPLRLACQAAVVGERDIVVNKPGVHAAGRL
jgi:2Fe-2S ferredoxin